MLVRTARTKVHYDGRCRCSKFMQHDFIMRSKMSVIKSKMGTIKSKIGRKFEQKRKAKWINEKANLHIIIIAQYVNPPTKQAVCVTLKTFVGVQAKNQCLRRLVQLSHWDGCI